MKKLRSMLAKAARNFHYEHTGNGILFPKHRVLMGGVFSMQVNSEPVIQFPNTVVDEFLVSGLEQLFGATAKIGTYYIAPFAGNVTPTGSWTAANFASNSTEFTNYSEASRVLWDVGSVAANAIGNVSNRAVFTIAAGAQTTIWGAGLLSAQAKSATSGVLVAAARAGAARDNLVENDVIQISYEISFQDAS